MTQSEIQQQFSHMNPMQRQAVFATEGPLLILAGAGSGKTTVLVNRIAYILQSGLCRPWNILAITFTNKAAGELKERICSAVPEGGADIWAATFHSTCARILRRYGDRLGYSSHFTVYATDDQKRLMKEIVKQLNIDEKILPVKSVLSEISKAKDKMQTPAEMLREADHDYRKQSIAKAYEIYQKRLQTADAMDFDDLLCKAVELFRQNPEILGYYQNQFKYIMVDEYQDTNRVQYEFVRMLAEKHGNICVVGDDDQSIYKFRGATIENILSFENTFKGAQIIRLEQNYRSTKTILSAANEVISNNTVRKGKTLWTENAEGEKIELHTCEDERDEAAFIARTIMDGVADGRRYADYAILYRTNAQSNAIEQALSRSGVPHRIIGGHRFYDREEIRDMIAYLQVINNPHDDVRLRRIINVPKRGIGGRTLEIAAEIGTGLGESIYTIIKDAGSYPQLSRSAAKLKSFVALIDGLIEAEESGDYSLAELYNLILEHTNYEAYLRHEKENADVRIENIEELSSNIIKFEEDYGEEADLSGFLEEISLMTDIDNYDAEADTCVMMTLHSAKGLEFPVVFITGMEDGLFPSIASMMNPEEIGEERRLAYVGITRAKEKLYLTKTRTRMLFGSTTYNKESCFVSEIPDELMERTGERKKTFLYGSAYKDSGKATAVGVPSASGAAPKKQPFYQKPAVKSGVTYSVGDTVLHKVFGKGLVMSAQRMGNDTLLEIAFDKAGTKKLMANFCKMEKL
ncbi:MAG: UvrD-helicase domain-containing protein [Ruminococcus sp.]|nr:UvrD-helicase domain-containing protein [Ruminococcus sp.]MBQ1600808.1 UvrD-helicase domain-containing protein [Ruminococcus sp.]MBQ1638916.1 UvrD-helicase domain-containing protein [Ruminococcus sp.]MBQ1944878.1 UvrD-helicase domain-containing protein [Ruminococcus sp.]MBQ1974655.1 UvrD-helicase domain-containing protein [Ruminococcus sp.]